MTKILVVEDEPLLRIMAEDVVLTLGHEAVGAEDGSQAIAVAEASPELEVLVTDVNLGSGPTGWEVASSIRQTHPTILVIYTSGLASAHDHSRHGVMDSIFLAKPYAPEELADAIRSFLASLGGR
ncbi:CheY-like chemotaxis protein [Inquilinus ginsengisoli]|jgi:CheY-like chemotaxis protein|uniref:response regulator n=1 Tax=Inquilinus ginsengisoli TaxID=363840 RepID=UPI003D2508B3